MRILAFSDLHGRYYKEANHLIRNFYPNWVVLLGDILPDFRQVSGTENRLTCQRDHWQSYSELFESSSLVTTFVRGNHEIDGFVVSTRQRRIPSPFEGKVIRLEGIPAEFGPWGWSREWDEKALITELAEQRKHVADPSVVLSHVPPFGCLDEVHPGQHIGHRPLANWLLSEEATPELVLCGHVHEARGFERLGRSLVVNLAEGYALLEHRGEGTAWSPWRIQKLMSMEDARFRLEDEL